MTLIKNSSLIKAEQTKWDLLKDVFADRAREEEYIAFFIDIRFWSAVFCVHLNTRILLSAVYFLLCGST